MPEGTRRLGVKVKSVFGERHASAAALTLALCACGGENAGGSFPATQSLAAPAVAQLLFQDSFNGSTLDTRKWFWCYPNGSPKNCTNNQHGIRYREREQYRPTQISISAGQLHLIAVRQSVKARFPWTSGMVATGGPFTTGKPKPFFAFRYGYAEIRVRLPAGSGFWPAFWFLPSSGAWPPEIDVMEEQGAQPHRVYMTVHFSTTSKKDDSIQGVFSGPNLSKGFHSYGIDWAPGSLTWYFDGISRLHVTAKQIAARGGKFPRTPMYLLLNLAVGGWVSPPNKHTPSPAAMMIKYVRVWNRRP